MVIIASIIAFILFTIVVVFAASRPHFILYALAAVVSLVGINIHLGATFYLSRIVIIVFLISLLLRFALGRGIHLPFKFLSKYVVLFSLIIFAQLISTIFSLQILDSMRQVFIYLSMMAIFIAVIMVGTSIEVIIKAIKIYLVMGLVQGIYGIYMVIGGPFGWPTYQTLLLADIPVANDHTRGGHMYFGAFGAFRAMGFFPADMSHYAGYMAGILILAMAYMVYDRRLFLPYLVVLFGGAGLLLSFSRSGLISFVVFGIPALIFLLSRVRPPNTKGIISLIAPGLLGLTLAGVIGPPVLSSLGVKLPNTIEIISTRMDDLFAPANSQFGGSMEEHIATRVAGLDALVSSPLVGVGLGVNASPWYSESYDRGWAGSHSHHLDILGQTGLIGTVLQFLFMALVGSYMWRGLFVTRENSLARHLLAGLLAAYIAILFGNFMYHYFMLDIVWFLMGCGMALSRLLILDAGKKRIAIHSGFSANSNRGEVVLKKT